LLGAFLFSEFSGANAKDKTFSEKAVVKNIVKNESKFLEEINSPGSISPCGGKDIIEKKTWEKKTENIIIKSKIKARELSW